MARQKYFDSTVKKDKKISPRTTEVLLSKGLGLGMISKMGKTAQRVSSYGSSQPPSSPAFKF